MRITIASKYLAVLFFVLLCSCVTTSNVANRGAFPSRYAYYPNLDLTPGDAEPNWDPCKSNVRRVPQGLKIQVFHAYGIDDPTDYPKYEIDHLIPICMGGRNTVKNLWPEPYGGDYGARKKDVIEMALHLKACRGEMTLDQARNIVAKHWLEYYKAHYQGQDSVDEDDD